MDNGKIIIARLWPKYGGDVPSRTPVILGLNPDKYETINIYHTKNSPNPNVFEQNGKKVFYLTEKSSLGLLKFFAVFKLAALLRKQRIDILHCHKHKSIVYGVLAGKLARVTAIIAHIHGMGRTRNRRRKFMNRYVLSQTKKILAVSGAVKNDIIKNNPSINPDNIINIGNSIDYNKFSQITKEPDLKQKMFGFEKESFVFATAGRLTQTKGQVNLIKAFAQVKKDMPNAKLVIAGDGQLRDELENLTNQLGLGQDIYFAGRVEDMLSFYSAIDVFVLPSIAEGLPRSLLEAMACETYCIGSDAGGIPEILDNGKLGKIVPAKNLQALSEAMIKIMQMPEKEKTQILQEVKKYVRENYSHGVVIKKLEKIYNDMASI